MTKANRGIKKAESNIICPFEFGNNNFNSHSDRPDDQEHSRHKGPEDDQMANQ